MQKKKEKAPEKERKNQALSSRAEKLWYKGKTRPLDSAVGRVARCRAADRSAADKGT